MRNAESDKDKHLLELILLGEQLSIQLILPLVLHYIHLMPACYATNIVSL